MVSIESERKQTAVFISPSTCLINYFHIENWMQATLQFHLNVRKLQSNSFNVSAVLPRSNISKTLNSQHTVCVCGMHWAYIYKYGYANNVDNENNFCIHTAYTVHTRWRENEEFSVRFHPSMRQWQSTTAKHQTFFVVFFFFFLSVDFVECKDDDDGEGAIHVAQQR